jgi:hypothetical protein
MPKLMDLSPDFKEFIQLLNAHDVQYLVVGGYAVALHGYPRNTKDIDIWLWLDATNAEKLLQTLDEFGFGSLGLTIDDFLVPDQIIQLGYPPARIDLLTTLPGVDFADCYESRLEIQVDNVTVNFIDLENLKRNKRASGRPQDIADLANLK